MIRKLLGKLLGLNKHGHGGSYRPHRSSDDYRKQQYGQRYNQHNQYGNSHYKKRRSSSSYSS